MPSDDNPTMLEILQKAEAGGKISFEPVKRMDSTDRHILEILQGPDAGMLLEESSKKNSSIIDADSLNFEGRYKTVVEATIDLLNSQPSTNNYLQLYLHSPRLLRGFINYNLEADDEERDCLRTKQKLSEAIAHIFGGRLASAKDELVKLNPRFGASLQKHVVEENRVYAHWAANSPDKSLMLIERINQIEAGKPDYLVLIGHSSYRQGYVLMEETGIPAYPIRFSTRSKEDEEDFGLPLFAGEESLLCKKFSGKNVLVFDEFMMSGKTIDMFAQRLSEMVPDLASLKLSCANGGVFGNAIHDCTVWDYVSSKESSLSD